MPVTQKDIARRLSISQSLVAGVLGDKPGIWVSDEKRLLIRRTAVEMGYRPNAAARMLRRQRSDTVAFVTLQAHDVEQAQIIEVLAAFLQEKQYELKLKVYVHQADLLEGLEEMARSGACDVVFLDGDEAHVEEQAQLLERLGTPFIVKGRFEETHPAWPQVDFDHERMMAESVRHLTAGGHRRINYLGFDSDRAYAFRLRAGFEQAMWESVGVRVTPDDIGLVSGRHEETAQAQTERWLSRPMDERPTALVVGASSTGTWQGIELALARRGRRIGGGPDDLSVTGLHYESRPLLFGEARVFSDIDSLHLTDVMCRQILAPLLADHTPAQPVVRFCPNWHALASLRLLDYVTFRTSIQ